jgi:Dyp-type peroxidase family
VLDRADARTVRASEELSMRTSHWVPLDQVQGNVTPGFRKDVQSMLFLRYPSGAFAGPDLGGAPETANVRAWLGKLLPSIASAEEVATYNRLYRQVKQRIRGTDAEQDGVRRFVGSTCVNVAFTARGLGCLIRGEPWTTDDTLKKRLEPFREGLCTREGCTGDHVNDLATFVVRDSVRGNLGRRHVTPEMEEAQVAHALVIVGADEPGALEAEVGRQRALAEAHGLTVLIELRGQSLGNRREHFGFTDAISQPEPDDPLAGWHSDGVNIVAPGEFIRGCVPEPERLDQVAVPAWEQYGSYLVFRMLEQDVARFWSNAQKIAEELFREEVDAAPAGDVLHGVLEPTASGQPSPAAQLVAASFMGRWPSGAKLNWPRDPARFPTDPVSQGWADDAMSALTAGDFEGDLDGARCPIFSHVRKSHPRTTASGLDDAGLRIHRIVRRGIPYEADGKKGLLFLAYQARLDDGYEEIQGKWINDAVFGTPAGDNVVPTGQDPLSTDRDRDIQNQMLVPFRKEGQAPKCVPLTFSRTVTARGGGYFFSPSLKALDLMARDAFRQQG